MSTEALPNAGEDIQRIHKSITRALNLAHQHTEAPGVIQAQQDGFSAYLRALTILLHAHHSGEDALAFPFWRERFPKGPFDTLIAQHQGMLASLARLERWLEESPAAWKNDRLSELHTLVSQLQALWLEHIALEEATIGETASRRYLTPEENQHLAQQLAEHGQAHSIPNALVMPFIIYNLEEEERVKFARLLPQVVLEQLIPGPWKAIWAPMSPFLLPAG